MQTALLLLAIVAGSAAPGPLPAGYNSVIEFGSVDCAATDPRTLTLLPWLPPAHAARERTPFTDGGATAKGACPCRGADCCDRRRLCERTTLPRIDLVPRAPMLANASGVYSILINFTGAWTFDVPQPLAGGAVIVSNTWTPRGCDLSGGRNVWTFSLNDFFSPYTAEVPLDRPWKYVRACIENNMADRNLILVWHSAHLAVFYRSPE